MKTSVPDPSPQSWARLAGSLYLVIIIAGVLGELFVRGTMVVPGDAVATAGNLVAHQALWRAGIAGDLVMHVCDVLVMLGLYVLLGAVNRNLARLALIFTVVQTAVLVANKATLLVPLFLLGDADYLQAFEPAQLQALSQVAIRLHGYGFGIGLIFFGCACLCTGRLIFKSGFLPWVLGPMMQLAGVCYLVNSFALLLAPELADRLFPFILLPCFIAELSLASWLLLKGVDVAAWKRRAAAA